MSAAISDEEILDENTKNKFYQTKVSNHTNRHFTIK